MFDELTTDERLHNPEERFLATVFFKIVNLIYSQLNSRFSGHSLVCSLFSFLFPITLCSSSNLDIENAVIDLLKSYTKDFSHELSAEVRGL